MSNGSIMLATAKVDITPQTPVELAGYGFREGKFESVHMPLELRCFIFSYPEQEVVLLSADLLWWGRDTIVGAQKKLEHCLPDVDRNSILFLATHNHCGPQVSNQFSSQLGECDSGYVRFLTDQIAEVIKAAQKNRHRVAATLFKGETDIPINRRKVVGSSIQMAPNPQGPRDTRLRLIEFVAVENGPLFQSSQSVAVLACAACHPTSSPDNQVDQEFLSRGVSMFASRLSTDTLGCFVQGCCGDTRPNLVADGNFVRGRLDAESELLATQFFSEEMVTEYALFVQELTQGRVWCGSYCGGVRAYVGTEQQILEGGYETEGFIYNFLCPAPFDIGIEKVIKKRITELIQD